MTETQSKAMPLLTKEEIENVFNYYNAHPKRLGIEDKGLIGMRDMALKYLNEVVDAPPADERDIP